MIRFNLLTFLFLCLFLSNLDAQTASIGNKFTFSELDDDASEFLVKDSLNNLIIDKNIPSCGLPEGISIEEKKNDLIIFWDNPFGDQYELSIKVNDGSRSDEIRATYSNALTIESTLRNSIDEILIRRVCKVENVTIYSDWVNIISYAPGICAWKECKDILPYLTYNVEEEIDIYGDTTYKKYWRMTAPPEYEKVEFSYEYAGETAKQGGYEWHSAKEVLLSPGVYEEIEVPTTTTYTRLNNFKVKKYGQPYSQCYTYYAATLLQNNSCSQYQLFYTQEEETDGSYTFTLFVTGGSDPGDAYLNVGNNTVTVPLIMCPVGSETVYVGQYNTCENFGVVLQNCILFASPVINPCATEEEEEVSCFDFEFETFPIIGKQEESLFSFLPTESKCYFNWSFPSEIESGSISKVGGGPTNLLTGSQGLLLLPKGNYKMTYKFRDADDQLITCEKSLIIDCETNIDPPPTDEEIDHLIPCDLVEFDFGNVQEYNGQVHSCNILWNAPDTVSVLVELQAHGSEEVTQHGTNSGNVSIRDLLWKVTYTIAYNHPIHGLITNKCDALYVQCPDDVDTDGDGILDGDDNCVDTPNEDQADSDEDGIGDVCEADTDGDSIIDDNDNCVYIPNTDQADYNMDGVGDVCEDDNDADDDGIPDDIDNCPVTPNTDQLDEDEDGIGDACDPDGVDSDGDGINDDADNCPTIPNSNQLDSDNDGIGDVCEPDTDGDSIIDDIDNCVYIPNTDQSDVDNDNIGDVCEEDNDADDDGIDDDEDNCPTVPNSDQLDSDKDGIGDVCEPDTDGDTIIDDIDNCVFTPNTDQADIDEDGIGDVCDPINNNEDDLVFNDDLMCNLFSSLQAVTLNESSFILEPNDDLDEIFETASQEQLNEISLQLTLVKTVSAIITFENDDGANTETRLLYDIAQYAPGVSIDFESLTAIIESNSTIKPVIFVEIIVTSIDGITFECGQMELPIEEEEIPEEEDDVIPGIPDLECGVEFESPDDNSSSMLPELKVGNKIYMHGFPLVISEVTSSNYPFAGTAIVPLPFTDNNLTIPFAGLSISKDSIVNTGEINLKATAAQLGDINVINVPVLTIGKNYCVPPDEVSFGEGGTSTDENNNDGTNNTGSFGDDGIHSGTGTTYDWNGFDENGMHFTGNPYNEWGCTAEGIIHNSDPEQDCDPSQPFSQIDQIINELEPVLDGKITEAIEDLLDDFNINIEDFNCAPDKEALLAAFGTHTNGMDEDKKRKLQAVLFGENNEFIEEGMSALFESAPMPTPENGLKAETMMTIERLHLDLYQCDKSRAQNQFYLDLLNDATTKADIKRYVLDELSSWTQYEVEVLFDPNNSEKFAPWLKSMIAKYFDENHNSNGDTGYIEHELFDIEEKLYEVFDFNSNGFFSLADVEYMDVDIDKNHREAFEFEFDQGFKEVLGVNRAYFLEEIAMINGDNSSVMPQRIPTPMDGKTVDLYIDDLKITATQASIDVYAIIDTKNGKIVLQADDIVFTSSGIESVTLELKSEIELLLINPAKINIKANDTSISWKCGGLDNFKIKADIEVCNDYIKPYDLTNKKVLTDESVTFSITGDGKGWMDFTSVIEQSYPFVVTGYESWVFDLTKIIIDNSTNDTPSFTPLLGYKSNFMVGGKLAAGWKGFYLESLKIHIPDKMKNGASLAPIEFHNVLFDDQGASGKVNINQELLSMDKGSIGGWGMSIEGFSLTVMKNNLSGFGLHGKIKTPLFEEDMEYVGAMHGNDTYSLIVKQNLSEPKNVPLFIAEANLTAFEISAISAPEYDHMRLSATISGDLALKDGALKDKLNLPKMTFTNLTIKNYGKLLDVESWKLDFDNAPEPVKLFGFELGFGDREGDNSINVKTDYDGDPGKVGIPFYVNLDFLKDKVSIGGNFDVVGFLDKDQDLHEWKYDDIYMNGFKAEGTIGPATFNADVYKYDEPNYGKGFRGEGRLELDLGPLGLKVDIISEFGRNGEDKYFFVDALASDLPTIGVPPLGLNGFGGGISYGMNPGFNTSPNFSNPSNTDTGVIGQSFSGSTYTPNASYGYSFKALVLFEMMHIPELMNGSAFLSVALTESGSLDKIQFAGLANMLTLPDLNDIPVLSDGLNKLEQLKDAELGGTIDTALKEFTSKPPGAMVAGYVYLKLDVTNKVFTGDFRVFMNAYGVLEGSGTNGAVVTAKMRFAGPNDWYVNIGEPKPGKLCGVELDAFILNAQLLAYFNVGTTIPSFSQQHLNPRIRSFVRNNVSVSEAFRRNGGGIMFGMGFNVEIHASIWIGSIDVVCGAGFDVMIRKTNASCLLGEGSIGIDGWYSMGQVWAYVDAGLKIAGVEVLGVGLYAVLNAQFPNPTFMQAAVQVKIKLLFGTVKKTLRLEFGDKCFLVPDDPNDPLNFDLITLITPFNEATAIPTDENIAVYLAFPFEEKITATEEEYYEITDLDFEVVDSLGNKVVCTMEVIGDGIEVRIIPNAFLKPSMKYTVNITAIVEHSLNGNKSTLEQEKSTIFTTAERYSNIPLSNIDYSYPVIGMYNYYLHEQKIFEENSSFEDILNNESGQQVSQAYIQLRKGQPDIIENIGDDYQLVAKLKSTGSQGNVYLRKCTYSISDKKFSWSIPLDIPRQEKYILEISKMHNDEIQRILGNSPNTNSDISIDEVNMANALLESSDGSIVSDRNNIKLLSYAFRVSQYDNFKRKMDNSPPVLSSSSGQAVVNYNIEQSVIDALEFYGQETNDPLVEFKLDVDAWDEFLEALVRPLRKYVNKQVLKGNSGYQFVLSPEVRDKYYEIVGIDGISFLNADPKGFYYNDIGQTINMVDQTMQIDLDKVGAEQTEEIIEVLKNFFDYHFDLIKNKDPYFQPGDEEFSSCYEHKADEKLLRSCLLKNNGFPELSDVLEDVYDALPLSHDESFAQIGDPGLELPGSANIGFKYPQWNTGQDEVICTFKYTLPDGKSGSSYFKINK